MNNFNFYRCFGTSAWLEENENASLPAIRRRMEIVTGLIYTPETASEHFQVSLSKFNFPIKNQLSFLIKGG